jgi:plastocyanin
VLVIALVGLAALVAPTLVAAQDEPQLDQATTTEPATETQPPVGAPDSTAPAAEPVQAEAPSAASSQKGAAAEAQTAPRAQASAPQAEASSLEYVVMQTGNKFVPATKTVSEGDTVEWTNEDQIVHNVTADDGSFKSKEQMANGETYRHKFSQTGEFTYSCTLHPPDMTGKIVVEAASAAGTSGSDSGGSGTGSTPITAPTATTSSPSSGDGSSGSLPATGANLLVLALLGADLVLAGMVLREALERRRV